MPLPVTAETETETEAVAEEVVPPPPPLTAWEIELAKAAGTWEGDEVVADEKMRCRLWCQIAKASLQVEEKEREKDKKKGEGKVG